MLVFIYYNKIIAQTNVIIVIMKSKEGFEHRTILLRCEEEYCHV